MSFEVGQEIFYPCHGYGTVSFCGRKLFKAGDDLCLKKIYILKMRSGIEITVPSQDTSCIHPVPPPDGVQCVPCRCANLGKNLQQNPKVPQNNSEE